MTTKLEATLINLWLRSALKICKGEMLMARLTYESWSTDGNDFFDESDDGSKGALNVLQWAFDTYDDELVYACSHGVEGIVRIDLISQIKPTANVVFLDTELH